MIAHCRVDSRVVHGQTTTRVMKEYPVDAVIVVDDEIASDPFMQTVYASALGATRLFAFSSEKALRKLPEAAASKKSYLVIFKTPATVRALVQQGLKLDCVLNIGPQPNCDGATLVTKMLYLTSEQAADLDYLEAQGINMIVNPAFTTPTLGWAEAKRKLEAK